MEAKEDGIALDQDPPKSQVAAKIGKSVEIKSVRIPSGMTTERKGVTRVLAATIDVTLRLATGNKTINQEGHLNVHLRSPKTHPFYFSKAPAL